MTTVATRAYEVRSLEGFDVEFYRDHEAVDPKMNGLPRFNYEKPGRHSWTVEEWRNKRFRLTYAGYDCNVLLGDGNVANGNTKLETVRASYEEE